MPHRNLPEQASLDIGVIPLMTTTDRMDAPGLWLSRICLSLPLYLG